MSKIVKTTSKVSFLVVLIICLYIKGVDAYSVLNNESYKTKPNIIDKIENIPSGQSVQPVVAKADSRIVSSNVLMIWKEDDGTVHSRSFDNKEFDILVAYAKTVGTEEFNKFMDSSKTMPTKTIITIAKNKLDNWSNLQASNDRG